MPYEMIVVGTDGTPAAARAVVAAAGLATACGARLVVVTAHGGDRDTASATAVEGAGAARDAGAPEVIARCDQGAPADVLLAVADDVGADLLVVGSKAMTDATRFVIGSVANTVSHGARCDVLVVHPSG